MREKNLKSLPLAGAELIKLRFCGNGKDSEVTIETAGNRTAVIPLNDARIDLTLSGAISVALKGWGDTAVVWDIAPTPDQCITLEEAAVVDFPGSNEEWNEVMLSCEHQGTLGWAVALRLKLISTERKSDGPGIPPMR
jgi:hypothetical protein